MSSGCGSWREKRAEQKDRLMVPVLAIEQRETEHIMKSLCRSHGFVQRWAYAYGDGGIEVLAEKPRGGSEAKISGAKAEKLEAPLDAGAQAWQKLTPQLLRPFCNRTYLPHEIEAWCVSGVRGVVTPSKP